MTSITSAGSTTASSREPVEALAARLGGTGSTLLAVWAHPDDESFLGAGLMAEAARRGGRVVNVVATLGEHGTDDPIRQPPAALATSRSRELDDALRALGIEPALTLGYPDGACDEVPDALGAHHVGSVIEQVRPDVVLGFGPDGVTGHPDHRAVARWTALAVAQRGDRVPLVATAAGSAWPQHCVDRLHGIGAFWPGYPERSVDHARVDVHVEGDLLDRKLAALACHRSQITPVQVALGPVSYRDLVSVEAYRAGNAAADRLLHPQLREATA